MKISKFKVKIVCGHRKDQEFTIDANETHRAYFLFNNPQKRGTFDSGLSVLGADIRRIEPGYHATMGWNPEHLLNGEDYRELEQTGTAAKLKMILENAKEIASYCQSEDLKLPLIDLVRGKYAALNEGGHSVGQQALTAPND